MATSPKSRLYHRKRRYSEAELSQDDLPSQSSKRYKRPPAFWNNLSTIPLTRSSLKEVERRYALSDWSCARPKVKKPRTRRAVREFKQRAHETVPVSEYLQKASLADIALLKVFATQQRRGGPDLTDLRGYQEPRHTMSSSRSSSKRPRSADPSSATSRSRSRKSVTPYDRGFEQNLIDHGVYLDNRAQTPENMEEINERLANPRPSLSPSKFSETAFKAFRASDFRAKDEDDVMIDVVPVIHGVHQNNHHLARKTKFGNLDPLTDGTIVPANPDLFYGARPEQLDREIRDKLSGHIVPSTMEDKPMVPNFFLEAKGPDGSLAVAGRQACYDGAVGARGIQSLQSYKQDQVLHDNNAYTITSTYHGGTLKLYTTHTAPPAHPGKRPEYHMTQLGAWALTGSREQFRQGATAFRNGRDLAKQWRDEFISIANERVCSQDAEPSTVESSNGSRQPENIDTYVPEESDTSADELTLTSFSHAPKQLALSVHPAEEPESSGDEVIFTSFSRPIEDDSADELAFITNMNPMASKRRPGQESKKTISKAPRHPSDQSGRDKASLLEGDDSHSSHAASRDITPDTVLSHIEEGAFKKPMKKGRLVELHQETP